MKKLTEREFKRLYTKNFGADFTEKSSETATGRVVDMKIVLSKVKEIINTEL